MNELIFELVELAISLAHTELDGSGNTAQMLFDIADKAAQAYKDHTGEELDPFEITAEDRV